ncbi:hypothetical protein GCM10018954_019040 [Kutzneria kofuensis]
MRLSPLDNRSGEHPDPEAGLDAATEFDRHRDGADETADGHEDAFRRAIESSW